MTCRPTKPNRMSQLVYKGERETEQHKRLKAGCNCFLLQSLPKAQFCWPVCRSQWDPGVDTTKLWFQGRLFYQKERQQGWESVKKSLGRKRLTHCVLE